MSGGYFDYQEYVIGDIARSIEHDIARALQPKPVKVHEDYWTIEERDQPHSYHSYRGYLMFAAYKEAESFLLSNEEVVKADSQYADGRFFNGGVIFQSTKLCMTGTSNDEQIPVLYSIRHFLYSIRHCIYDHFQNDADVLELSDCTVETLKEAYKQIRIAEIYAIRVDRMMSGDDGEDTFHERLKDELKAFEKEIKAKNWAELNDDVDI